MFAVIDAAIPVKSLPWANRVASAVMDGALFPSGFISADGEAWRQFLANPERTPQAASLHQSNWRADPG